MPTTRRTPARFRVAGIALALLAVLLAPGAAVAAVTTATSGPWKQISAGATHTCAVAQDTTVWCWGTNSHGELGNNGYSSTGQSTPRQVLNAAGTGALIGIKTVALGVGYSCALANDGTVSCWGDNGQGQLGNGPTPDGVYSDSWLPVHVVNHDNSGPLTGIRAITAGWGHACALADDGTVWCWGDGGFGELGNNATDFSPVPVHVSDPSDPTGPLTGVTAVAAGGQHACALKADGTVWCWGDDQSYQLGATGYPRSTVPVQVQIPDPNSSSGIAPLAGATAIAAGLQHTCALISDGSVWCWGDYIYGQLGSDQQTGYPEEHVAGPSGTGLLTGVTAISAADRHSCALGSAGAVWCWGNDSYGQLGDDSTGQSDYPLQVHGPGNSGSLTGISAISVGGYHSCALADTGSAWCWGGNQDGELGDGTPTQRLWPTAVLRPTTTALTGPASTPQVGVVTTYTATVSPVPAGGTVSFTVDGNATGCDKTALDPVTGTASCAITFKTAGDHQVTASFSGSTYDEASTSSLTQTVDKGSQTIDFPPPGDAEVGETLTPVATSTANLPVTFRVDANSAAVCSYDAGTGKVTFNAPGSCVVDADQSGDANYQAAPQVQQTIAVSKATTAITVTSSNNPSALGGDVTFTVTVSPTPSGGTVAFTGDGATIAGCGAVSLDASGTATCDKSYVHAGTHQLDASFSGTASQAVRTATLVQTVDKGTQTITFASTPPSNATVGGSYTPTATSTSGRQVTITIDTGSAAVCAIDGAGTVSFTAAGTCVIDADQPGDSDYLPAAQVQQQVTVAAPPPPPSGGGGGGSGQPGSGLPGPVTGEDSATSTDPAGTAVAKQGCATATASGAGTVTLATYGSDPVDPADFRAADVYFDLRTDSASTFSQLVLTCQAAGTSGNTLYWWDGSAWRLVSGQSFDPASTTVAATLIGTSSPSLQHLTGTVFALGVRPVVARRSGTDREHTAIAVSRATYPAGAARAVVLAREDAYPDALVGGPLAAAKDAPLLLTASGKLDKPVATEIRRVLPSDGTVLLLGGKASLAPAVARRLTGLGYRVHRLGGATRYDTAVAVADYLRGPKAVLLATGTDFPDALTAADAAAHEHGVVLLTQGTAMPAQTKTWLAQHPALPVWAVGGPAAAAAPSATPLVGQDRYATAAATATTLFGDPALVGVASGLDFPDALTAVGRLGHLDAPLLLTAPTRLSASTRAYLTAHAGTLSSVELYGGRAAVGSGVQAGVTDAVGGISR